MLHKIIEFSVKNKLIIALFTLGLLIYGIYEAGRLPIDAQPDITNNQVQVITVAPSYGAADIERLVTFPIEQATGNIKGISEMRSFSRFGLSLVTIVFNDATDVYWARQQVFERLQLVKEQIPEGIGTPELGPISTGLGEIFQYVVRAKKGYEQKYTATELRTIQDWTVRRQLLGTKGVADVSSFGGKLKQYEVAISPNRLHAYNISINQVFDALERNNQNTGGAYIEKKETVLFIRSEGLIGNLEDIRNIPVANTGDGVPVMIRDVADVRIGYATRYGAMTYNNTGEVSGAIVLMLKGENASEVIANIKKRLSEIEKSLPEGVMIEPFLDRAKMVSNTISTVKTNLLEGALIVVFILVLFLGNLRAGLLVASVIPLAMLFAVIMMNLTGVGGNLMSLGALDFGLIVDGAVIIVEAVLHQLAHRKSFGKNNVLSIKEMNREVSASATKMANSAVFGQIIILIVYLPILTLQGIEGKMFKPMAQTVAFALVGAFILSLTYIPMMSALVLSRKRKAKANLSDRVMAKLELFHQKYLLGALKFRKVVITAVLILFLGAVLVLTKLGGEFIPTLEEGDFAVEMRILQGSNINKTIEVTRQAAAILQEGYPEVEKVVTKIGSAEIPTEPMPMDAGDMIIVLKPKSEWSSAGSFPELAEKMSNSLKVIPGLTTGFQFPVQMRFNELMTGARQDVVCKIYGENLDSLAALAAQLGTIINTVKGAQDLYIEPVAGEPQLVIEFNRAALARYGISIREANRIVNMTFAGQSTGLVYEGERRFDLVVRMDNEQKQDIGQIRNLLIPAANGMQVPLDQLAAIGLRNSPNQIQREEARRRIVVGFNVRGRDVQSIVEDLQSKVAQQLKLPGSYAISYGGAFENLNQAKARLGIAVPVSLALIFLLLFFAFGSVKHSLLIYTAIPLSAIGGIYFLALRGMPFSISAGIGFIALFGVAVLNGIVLIAEFNRLKKSGLTNTTRIVLKGTRTRLRPVLMTAFVASLGFLPMAISNGSGAEVQRPLATVVIGGLMLATLLTLFMLPILYILFEHIKAPKLKWKKKTVITLVAALATGSLAQAQQSITLVEAFEMAARQHKSITGAELKVKYAELLTQTSWQMPQAELNAVYGQTEGLENDNSFSITQRMNFPAVYKRRKAVLQEELNYALSGKALILAQLKQKVSEVFYQVLVLRQQEQLLQYSDSIYTRFAQKAALKVELGASGLLEESTAEIQKEQIRVQLNAIGNAIRVAGLQLQFLLQSDVAVNPVATSPKLALDTVPEAGIGPQHPELRLMTDQVQINESLLRYEKSKLLPDLSLAYENKSMKNLGGQRFNSVQLGVGIPIFNRAQHAAIRASRQQVTIADNELALKQDLLHTSLQQADSAYQNQLLIIRNFETRQLPRAQEILKTAEEKYIAGDISYLDWVLLVNQSIKVQADYTDALTELNALAAQINYLHTK